jgi:D-alanyl-lipoteichoic acid acyltransferase DltB (MBOAT superfamily)
MPMAAFAVPAPTNRLSCGVYAFSFQIFLDFSGYTDIARGCKRGFSPADQLVYGG